MEKIYLIYLRILKTIVLVCIQWKLLTLSHVYLRILNINKKHLGLEARTSGLKQEHPVLRQKLLAETKNFLVELPVNNYFKIWLTRK